MRLIDLETDYSTLEAWWAEHGTQPIPRSLLPKVGLIEDNLCAGFLYQTDSSMALVEFLVSNPKSDKIKVGRAIKSLMEEASVLAENLGYTHLFTEAKGKSLTKLWKRLGMEEVYGS